MRLAYHICHGAHVLIDLRNQAFRAASVIQVFLTELRHQNLLLNMNPIHRGDKVRDRAERNAVPIREGHSQSEMSNQCTRVSRMPKMLVHSGPNQAMIVLDSHGAGEIPAEVADVRPPDDDSKNQERESGPLDQTASCLDAPDTNETEDHSDRLDGISDIPESA